MAAVLNGLTGLVFGVPVVSSVVMQAVNTRRVGVPVIAMA